MEQLESRQLLAFNPTGQEQEMLELINDLRQNAGQNFDVMIRQGQVENTLDLFRVNVDRAEGQLDALNLNVPPLAWDAARTAAARAHAKTMRDQNTVRRSGHAPENVLGLQLNSPVTVETMHTILAVDATLRGSSGDANRDGIADNPARRTLLMRSDLAEVGIGIATRTLGQSDLAFVNQQFERAATGQNPFVLGVVFRDRNDNNRYDAGEGLGGVTISIVNGDRTIHTSTMAAGGYQVRVPTGNYDVIAQGGDVGTPKFLGRANVSTKNVKLDLETQDGSRNDGVVTGVVFQDSNRNGVQDPGESGLAGRQVFISLDGNLSRGGYEAIAITDSNGAYRIRGVPAGNRTVRLGTQNGTTIPGGNFLRTFVIRDQTSSRLNFAQLPV